MPHSILDISLINMAIAFIPPVFVFYILYRWHMNYGNAIYANVRMICQLLIVGYLLVFIFAIKNVWLVLGILAIMITASGWIALGVTKKHQKGLFTVTLVAILVGGGVNLVLITQGVLRLDPWYEPRYVIPLAGMIFANAMNAVSLAVERLNAELDNGVNFRRAREIAFQASLIPTVNSLFAVGLVSLPGMMTGQILSGVSPLVAVRYQIVVMCMVFSSAGISSAIFLVMSRKYFSNFGKGDDSTD